ncbi:MAG: FecR domain-containing protein [Chloroflexi bacterium]|nr:FecR domain-containing protein [Chloroflexota bacterium]
MRAGFEFDLGRTLYTSLDAQATGARPLGERISGWLAVMPRQSFRPVLVATAFAAAMVLLIGLVLSSQLFSIGETQYASLSLDSGTVNVTRALHIIGDIELTRHLQAQAGEEMRILQGDKIVSGQDTIAVLVLPDKSRVELGAQSALDVTDLQPRSESLPLAITMRLERGNVRTEVEHLASEADKFEVSTPDLVAQVKGTVFRLDVGSAGTRVATDEGLVQVKFDGQQIDVAAGRELSLLLGETVHALDVRPQSPRLQSEILSGASNTLEDGSTLYYTSAERLSWHIQALPNASILFYVDDEVYASIQTDMQGVGFLEFVPPEEGIYRVTAVTELPNTESSLPAPEKQIVVDRTPPSLVLVEPSEPQVSEERVRVKGRTEPDVELLLNGVPISINADGEFEELLDLVLGANEMELVATDLAGNSIRLKSVIIYE